jgi:4-diphosphocytidyl-2-C-methyl-D-erythritol kinase
MRRNLFFMQKDGSDALTKSCIFVYLLFVMSDSVWSSAPCKINLHLKVLEKRPDGYHDIESVFQLISLADELSVSMSGERGYCEVVSPFMKLPAVNTVSKAVVLFRELTGVDAGIRVELAKRVPSGAGLGGGSSDAAAALVSLDCLFGTGLGAEKLVPLAEKIGSDVPFFLSGAAAVVSGRGEKVSPIPARDDLFGVLVWPDVHCPTPEAYGLVDRWHDAGCDAEAVWPELGELESLYRQPPRQWPFRNGFTGPVTERWPVIGEALAAIRSAGAEFSEMSGSGSAVFGLFSDEKDANSAQKMLSARWKRCDKFLLLASSPMR